MNYDKLGNIWTGHNFAFFSSECLDYGFGIGQKTEPITDTLRL